MPIPTVTQQLLRQAPLGSVAAGAAATAARESARAAYAVRDARHRRGGQAALAASILKLSGRRR
jgi:hypothetical protein